MLKKELLRNKVYSLLFMTLGALSVLIEYDATFFYFYPDARYSSVFCKGELDSVGGLLCE